MNLFYTIENIIRFDYSVNVIIRAGRKTKYVSRPIDINGALPETTFLHTVCKQDGNLVWIQTGSLGKIRIMTLCDLERLQTLIDSKPSYSVYKEFNAIWNKATTNKQGN